IGETVHVGSGAERRSGCRHHNDLDCRVVSALVQPFEVPLGQASSQSVQPIGPVETQQCDAFPWMRPQDKVALPELCRGPLFHLFRERNASIRSGSAGSNPVIISYPTDASKAG